MKRIFLFFIIICLSFHIFAGAIIDLGITFESDHLAEKQKIIYAPLLNDYTKIKNIHRVGPALNIGYSFFNSNLLEVNMTNELLFPVGVNKNEQEFKNRNMNFKYIMGIELKANWIFMNNSGIYANFGGEFIHSQMALTNLKNNKTPVDFNTYNDFGVKFGIGITTLIENANFNFGLNYTHSLISEAYTLKIIASGGFVF